MIIFHKLKYKNFLSSGDNFTEIDFTKSKTTLVVGQNGAGKSTMLDALSFVLFGKPHRNINKPQLTNSINKKDCLVEVDFTIGKSNFRIIRGIKPNIFQIYKNGQLLNESSHAKDYQKILEKNIIKMNHKSFHQIVVLGSTSFTPFMELPAAHRREVIEDLLDINIFSKMNILLKEKQSVLKEKIKEVNYQVEILSNKIQSQKKYINDIREINEFEITEKQNKIEENQNRIRELQVINENVGSDLEDILNKNNLELTSTQATKDKLLGFESQFKSSMNKLVKEVKFYEDNTHCPTCTQEIDDELRTSKISHSKNKAKEISAAITDLAKKTNEVSQKLEYLQSVANDIRDKNSTIQNNNRTIEILNKSVMDLVNEIQKLNKREEDLDDVVKELMETTEKKSNLLESKSTINEDYSYNIVIAEMLKDTGIKTKILKQYVPIINRLVNQYLQVLDFFVSFNLDENFNEIIRSRYRDDFTYASFSEGEKQRISLALLFTWRQIARMKNSVSTNLLILDETFDSSLDFDGVENLTKILYTLDDNTNVFIISHKGEILENKFERKLEFYKKQNFSYVKE